MVEYSIKQAEKDFIFLQNTNMKGSREKRVAYDKHSGDVVIFKYQKYNCTEACSEKMAYELAKLLGYNCAKIELARDEKGNIGILNYIFIKPFVAEHTDAVAYINPNSKDRKDYYTIENIEKCLNEISKSLFNDFIKIMIFDAWVGETDRHEENWGILLENGKYSISPLYDNGCNLLREFKDESILKQYTEEGNKNFNSYINRSKTLIYNSDNGKKYGHFELVKKLKEKYEKQVKLEVEKLRNVKNKDIEKVVDKIPDELMTDIHKNFIKEYLIKRRDKILRIVE